MSSSRFGIGGHGLLLAPASPCAVTHREDGALLVSNTAGAVLVAPGDVAATHPVDQSSEGGFTTLRFGPQGPTVSARTGTPVPEVIHQLDVGLPPSQWMLLGPGAWLAFPRGLTLFSGDAPFFELHHGTDASKNIFMSFEVCEAGVILRPAPRQRLEAQGLDEGVRWQQFAYDVDGTEWRQRCFVLPYAPDAALVLRAQAPLELANVFFALATEVARSFEPVESEAAE